MIRKWFTKQTLIDFVMGSVFGFVMITVIGNFFPGFEKHPIIVLTMLVGTHISWVMTRRSLKT